MKTKLLFAFIGMFLLCNLQSVFGQSEQNDTNNIVIMYQGKSLDAKSLAVFLTQLQLQHKIDSCEVLKFAIKDSSKNLSKEEQIALIESLMVSYSISQDYLTQIQTLLDKNDSLKSCLSTITVLHDELIVIHNQTLALIKERFKKGKSI